MAIKNLFATVLLFTLSSCDFLTLTQVQLNLEVPRVVLVSNPSFYYKIQGQLPAKVSLYRVKTDEPFLEELLSTTTLMPGEGYLTWGTSLDNLRHRVEAVLMASRNGVQVPLSETRLSFVFDVLLNTSLPSVDSWQVLSVKNSSIFTNIILSFNDPVTANIRPGSKVKISNAGFSAEGLFGAQGNELLTAIDISSWNLLSNSVHTINYKFYNLQDTEYTNQQKTGTFNINP